MDYYKLNLIISGVCFMILAACITQSQNSLSQNPKLKVEKDFKPEGIIGRALVFDSPERTKEITDLSQVEKIYCRAYPYPKAALKIGSNPNYRLGLWQGSDCSFTNRTSCRNFYLKEGKIQSDWLNQEYIDFEIDTNAMQGIQIQDSEEKFFLILSGGPLFEQQLSISFPLAFNLKQTFQNIANQ